MLYYSGAARTAAVKKADFQGEILFTLYYHIVYNTV